VVKTAYGHDQQGSKQHLEWP